MEHCIIYSSRGHPIKISPEDYDHLCRRRWHIGPTGYVCGWERVYSADKKTSRAKTITMHRLIMKPPNGMHVDHINQDKSDNRRENLRLCTPLQNTHNQGPRRNSSSGYKGVYWSKKDKRWYVQLHVEKKKSTFGFFKKVEDAVKRYNEVAIEYHGEFAYINKLRK